MEIVNIEAKTFEEMLSKFEKFVTRTEHLYGMYDCKNMDEWLDNQDVCLLLNISKRTLQTLRDNGTLAFSRISTKIYYKPQDVEKILPLVQVTHKNKQRENSK